MSNNIRKIFSSNCRNKRLQCYDWCTKFTSQENNYGKVYTLPFEKLQ